VATEQADPFRREAVLFYNCIARVQWRPEPMNGAQVAAATRFYSTNQKSSVAIFIGTPIPRSDRFLSRNREASPDSRIYAVAAEVTERQAHPRRDNAVGVERDVLRPSGSADDFAGFGIGGWGLTAAGHSTV